MKEAMNSSMNVVNELNKVDGFEPRVFLRNLAPEGEVMQPYLDVVYRKLWFRLKNPEGKIISRILKLTDQVAVFEAKIYLDRHDPEECCVASATGQRYYIPNDPIAERYVELAETAAIGRALQLAGYGLQFPENAEDPGIVDAPMAAGQLCGVSQNIGYDQDNNISVQSVAAPVSGNNGKENTVPANDCERSAEVEIDSNMPPETIYQMLDRAKAEAVICNFGVYRGKTLGMIAMEKPESLVWFRDKYCGKDNLIKAAAAFLLDTALQQAG